VNETKDFDGCSVGEPLVEGIQSVRGDAHGARASTSRGPVGACFRACRRLKSARSHAHFSLSRSSFGAARR
jgi:hypothetical protein